MQTCEAIAPCCLWIDEIDKGFSGSRSSNSTDGGTSARVFGSFISWMQEKKAPVFVVATANDVSQLPPEMLRKGRFDELFFVDLPKQSERKQIFSIQLNKRKRSPIDFDLQKLATAAAGFSGAEIDAAVQSALYAAYSGKQTLTTDVILDVLSHTVPLSKTRAEEIQAQRLWAKTRAVPASIPDAQAERA